MFNFKGRGPQIAPLDTNGLLKLISSPAEATALWEQYEFAHAAYEALRASVAREQASLLEREKAVVAAETSQEAAAKELLIAQASFQAEQKAWDTQRAKELSLIEQKRQEQAAVASDLQGRLTAAANQESAFAQKVADRNALYDIHMQGLNDYSDELDMREAAVTAREKKAEELAKLLKSV